MDVGPFHAAEADGSTPRGRGTCAPYVHRLHVLHVSTEARTMARAAALQLVFQGTDATTAQAPPLSLGREKAGPGWLRPHDGIEIGPTR